MKTLPAQFAEIIEILRTSPSVEDIERSNDLSILESWSKEDADAYFLRKGMALEDLGKLISLLVK